MVMGLANIYDDLNQQEFHMENVKCFKASPPSWQVDYGKFRVRQIATKNW